MSNGEALKQEIRKSSEERINQVLAEARAKADSILSQAEEDARGITKRKVDETKKKIEQMEKSETARQRMAGTKDLLILQSKYVEKAFNEAESKIDSLPDANPRLYKNVLGEFVSEALDRLSENNLILIGRKEDRSLLENILKDHSTLQQKAGKVSISSELLNASGGVVVRSENMKVYYVNTFESRFLSSRERLLAKVEKALEKTE